MSTPNNQSVNEAPVARRSSVGFISSVALIGAIVGGLIYYMPNWYGPVIARPTGPVLKTGGTSAVVVILQNLWRSKYRAETGVVVDCDSAGSSKGVEGMTDKTYAIAFTHAALSDKQLDEVKKQGNDVVQIPLLLCGVAPIYNLSELKDKKFEDKPIKFTGEILANIFLGRVTKWDDPSLKAINPDLPLPSKDIKVIHRKDKSGTTLLFTEYLAAVSPEWVAQMGKPADFVKWPVGEAVERSPALASMVNQVDGSISYVDRLFTDFQGIKLDYGAVQNADKTAFVRAEPGKMTAAAEGALADIPENLAFSMANRPGKEAYPISGLIYAVCLKQQAADKRKLSVDFLTWAIHKGEADPKVMSSMGFDRLPDELIKRADKALATIK